MRNHEIPVAARGLLRTFAEAGLIRPIDFHLARRMAQAFGENRDEVELAFALATRELRLGSVCLDLLEAEQLQPESDVDDGLSGPQDTAVPWPTAEAWVSAVRDSDAVSDPDGPHRPFRLDGSLLYLERHFADEHTVAERLRAGARFPCSRSRRHNSPPPTNDSPPARTPTRTRRCARRCEIAPP